MALMHTLLIHGFVLIGGRVAVQKLSVLFIPVLIVRSVDIQRRYDICESKRDNKLSTNERTVRGGEGVCECVIPSVRTVSSS